MSVRQKYCSALGWYRTRRGLAPILPLRGVVLLCGCLAVVAAVAFLVDWQLRIAASKGSLWSKEWDEDNLKFNTENFKKILSTATSPLFRSVGYAPPAPAAGRRRILVVGDSFVWGDGHNNLNMTWWRQLGWELERRGYHDVDVVAAGLCGASTQDQLAWLRDTPLLKESRPDVIVFGYVTNDPHVKDESGKDLVKQAAYVAPPERGGGGEALGVLRRELATRAAASEGASDDETGYPYAEWELKLLEGENFRRYGGILKELKAFVTQVGTPTFFVTTPNSPTREYFDYRYPRVRQAFDAAGLTFIDLLPALLDCCSNTGLSNVSWGVNPANGHPGVRMTRFYAMQVADILESRHPGALGPKRGIQAPLPPVVNDWMPASVGARQVGAETWTFSYGGDERVLPRMPVGEPHVALNFERPVSMRAIKLSSQLGGEFKVWVTVLDDKNGHELQEYIPVGEGVGKEVEIALPWKAARRRIASVKIAYRDPGKDSALETVATFAPGAFVPSTGISFQVAIPQFKAVSDDMGLLARSPLLLLENGRPLGPAHSAHEEIRKVGGGRYSHWQDTLILSTPDGSDPRTNGRTYTLVKERPNELRVQFSFDSQAVKL